ncbi:MAG: alpha/beta fold hydrolase [Desulfovibrio sp.]|jgi:pimeloyl-ACP methyl ester carboxylesterase
MVEASRKSLAHRSVLPGTSLRRLAPVLSALLISLLCACAAKFPVSQDAHPGACASTLSTGGVALDYLDLPPREAASAAPPLLLITGYAVTKEMWDQDFVRALSAHRRVVLMDNRGMGPSPASDAAFGISDMARDAASLLEGLGINRADVLGWSMGGIIAQELALQRPELVRTLTLYATVADNAELMPVLDRMAAMPLPELLQNIFPAAWAAAHPDALSRLPARPRPADMDVIARQYAALKHWQPTLDRLPALRLPVLVLAGGQDWVCPPEQSRRIAAEIPGARLAVLPQGGHWMMHQFPVEMARLVDDFIVNMQPGKVNPESYPMVEAPLNARP